MTSSIINPIERLEVTQELSENIILTTVDDIYNWVKMSSLYPLMFGTACAQRFISHDIDKLLYLVQ